MFVKKMVIGYNEFGDKMKSIKHDITSTLIINKSKFITVLTPVSSLDEIKMKLDEIKKTYEGANHYCYAYITENHQKYSDDGEPTSSAGAPILNVLEKEKLTNLLCVVIRYFGGIKLGVGGLVRAYSKSANEALKEAEIIELKKGFLVEITFNYDDTKDIDFILKNAEIINTVYEENVTYQFLISDEQYLVIQSELKALVKEIEIKENVFI